MQNLPCDTGNAKSLHKFTGDLERSMNEMFTEVNKYIDTVPDPAVSQVKQMLGVFRRGVTTLSHSSFSVYWRQHKGHMDPWSDPALLFSMLQKRWKRRIRAREVGVSFPTQLTAKENVNI